MYDPSVGRWLSEDPLGFEGGDVNLYRYARNQAVSITDPSGLLPGDDAVNNWYSSRVSNWEGTVNGANADEAVRVSLDWFSQGERNILGQRITRLRRAVNQIARDLAVDRIDRFTLCTSPPRGVSAPSVASVERWFGNGGTLTVGQWRQLQTQLASMRNILANNTIPFENANSTYAVAWVPGWWFSDIHLGLGFWTKSPRRQVGILFHEMTHKYIATSDYGYFEGSSYFEASQADLGAALIGAANPILAAALMTPGPIKYTKNGVAVPLTPSQLISNADTYEGFLEEYYLSDVPNL